MEAKLTTKIQNEFWSKVADLKDFKDPFYLDQLRPYLKADSLIIEYGCGYGRLLNLLYEKGYSALKGFDFAQGMIARGKKLFPSLDLQLIKHAELPQHNESADAVLLSTVLCCVPDSQMQRQIIQELQRILKPGGALYVTDFLVTDNEQMTGKYQQGFASFKDWGVYQTSEGAVVRHHTQVYLTQLLSAFTCPWYHEEDFVTMNNSAVKTFHGVYVKA